MKLGESISRILVPHPILSEPTSIEILYTAYSGWLSSGLTQWRMDKVTISDSFGKTWVPLHPFSNPTHSNRSRSSICKKNLIQDSGIPVTLPLYPGECNLPGTFPKEAQDRVHDPNPLNLPLNLTTKVKNFIPTPVVRIGPEDLEKDYDKKKSPIPSTGTTITESSIPKKTGPVGPSTQSLYNQTHPKPASSKKSWSLCSNPTLTKSGDPMTPIRTNPR